MDGARGGHPCLQLFLQKAVRGTHFIAGSGNDEQSVSRNNEVLRRGCFSREKPPFSRWAPQSSEGVGETSHHIHLRNTQRQVPQAPQAPASPACRRRRIGRVAEGSPECSARLWVGCPHPPRPSLGTLCTSSVGFVISGAPTLPWTAKAGQQLSP